MAWPDPRSLDFVCCKWSVSSPGMLSGPGTLEVRGISLTAGLALLVVPPSKQIALHFLGVN